jgi:hypothetical protein
MRKYDVEYTYNSQKYTDTVALELITDDNIIQALTEVNKELTKGFDKEKLNIESVVTAGIFSDKTIDN